MDPVIDVFKDEYERIIISQRRGREIEVELQRLASRVAIKAGEISSVNGDRDSYKALCNIFGSIREVLLDQCGVLTVVKFP